MVGVWRHSPQASAYVPPCLGGLRVARRGPHERVRAPHRSLSVRFVVMVRWGTEHMRMRTKESQAMGRKIASASESKIQVPERALIQRINRALALRGEKILRSRPLRG